MMDQHRRPAPHRTDTLAPHGHRLILLADNGEGPAEVAVQLRHYGYNVRQLDDPGQLDAALADGRALALIINTDFGGAPLAGVERITACARAEVVLPPTLYVAENPSMTGRLAAVRSGGIAYFGKPVDVAHLADILDTLVEHEAAQPFHVMVMEAERAAAEQTASVLRKAGMVVHVVTEAQAMQQTLTEFRPELILMGLELNECTGIELAAVVRQQEEYVGIPIVFYAGEEAIDRHLEAIRRVGEDFLLKPLAFDYLVASLEVRVIRARVVNALMVRDSLTGLLNHSNIKEQLEREVAEVERYGGSLSYALIDLDFFKRVNDSYGHATGDRVLKTLARVLRQRIRQTDILGRYGGEEFAVVFPGTEAQEAVGIMEEIRQGFENIHHHARGEGFTVTLSAGVAAYHPGMGANALINAADRALYRAKETGRNRIVLLG